MTVPQKNLDVKPPVLPPKCEAALSAKYRTTTGLRSVHKLSQGEIDVLEMARADLGWPSIISLAHKYWPLFPHRKLWQRAVERCRHHRTRTATLNVRYLLLTLITVKDMALQAAYSGRQAVNRLLQQSRKTSNQERYRLTPPRRYMSNFEAWSRLHPGRAACFDAAPAA